MKRILLLILYFVSVLSAVSCIRELDDPAAGGGKPVTVTFDISLGSDLTKADNTALDNASGAFQLYVAAYSTAEGTLMPSSMIGGTDYAPTVTISGSGAQNVTMTLSKGVSYKVIFFAQRTGTYNVSFADNGAASFSYKSGLNANDGNLDAFYDVVDVSGTKTSYEVTLKRPFAQLNVLVKNEDVPTGLTSFSSTMTVKAPTTFDLYAGAATGDSVPITFADNAIAETPFGQYATTHKWIGMNYVLVPADGLVDVTSFKEAGMSAPIAPGKVPVKKNGRTNLVGSLYTTGFNATFTVQVGPGFDSQSEEQVGGQQVEITVADNSTYTPQNPLVINAGSSPTPSPQNVTLKVAGFSLSEVAEAAVGNGTIEASSSNEAVATAAVSGDDVVITPQGNGEATITVTTPAFTKTDYRASSFTIPVKVEGMDSGSGDTIAESATIIFKDLKLTNGQQYTEPFVKGDVSVTFTGGGNDGKYYDTGEGIRTYGGGSIVVSSAYEITKVEYTFASGSDYAPSSNTLDTIATGAYDLATQTWTGTAKEVTLTRKSGNGHWRLQRVTIHYNAKDESDKILTHEKFGCYLPDHERTYVAGVDQYVREHKGTPSTLDFVLLNAGENEQVIIRGYQDSMGAGDPVTVSVDWKKGTTRVLLQDYEMTVVKVENRKVWIANRQGNGFVIKK